MRLLPAKQMNRITAIACGIGALSALHFTAPTLRAAAPEANLIENGKSDYVIVLPESPIASEQRAARELQEYLKQISGAILPIQPATKELPKHAIILGTSETSALARAVEHPISVTELGADGFAIRKSGDHLLIGGGRPRGTMYGVYSFLEDDLGCRWWSEKVSKVPTRKTIPLPKTNRTELPGFEYREPFYTEAWDKDWAARNRCNGSFMRLDDETGGKIGYQPWAHSFQNIVDPKDYWTSHPEYFSEVKGKRTSVTTQLCLTNPDVIDMAKQKVNRWIRNHPEAQMISVSQNDHYNPCMCAECTKVFDATGSHSGQVLTFVNAIAAEVARKHPGKLIDTLAYQYTEKPPTNIVPADNVRVRLAPIDNCFAHAIDKCELNKAAFANLESWSSKTKNLYIWHYNTNFGNYPMPFPDLDELQGSARAYKRIGVKGIFFQGSTPKGGGGELAELRAWVLAKMLWNPSRDIWTLTDEFLNGYYGSAAKPIREYLTMMHAVVRDENIHFKIYTPLEQNTFLKPELIDRAEALFVEAEKAVASDAAILDRVQKARFSIDYVRFKLAKDPQDRARYAGILRDKSQRYGIVEVREWARDGEFMQILDKAIDKGEKKAQKAAAAKPL